MQMYDLPDAKGHFGPYGGLFVSETLIPALDELKEAYAAALRDPQFIAEFEYAHPIFDAPAIAAQQALPGIQGRRRTWFCGAWTGYGFHEDGLRSALAVVNALGVELPWQAQAAAA